MTLRTTERHYVVANTRVALQRHYGLVLSIRDSVSGAAWRRRRQG